MRPVSPFDAEAFVAAVLKWKFFLQRTWAVLESEHYVYSIISTWYYWHHMLISKKEDEFLDLDKLFENSFNSHPKSLQDATFNATFFTEIETITITIPDLSKAPILQGSFNYEAWHH